MWHKPATEGAGPSARAAAAAVCIEGQMLLFGGHGTGSRLNDVYTLDFHSWQWQQAVTSGTAPSPRQGAAMCLHGLCPPLSRLAVPDTLGRKALFVTLTQFCRRDQIWQACVFASFKVL